jgi:uncharacterized protein (TIGR04222 family)
LPSLPPFLIYMLVALSAAATSDLWAKLAALDLDGSASLSFSKRLARDNGWPESFAERVVLEYKRFVFLAATCGHPVTPSDEVDQAWHLHLVYTRSYWDDLCGQVLGFALHHGPTQGGAAEGHKFADWYARTLQSYQAAFGAVPPPDIWPAPAVRFGEAPYFRRVNRRRYFLLPRPRWRITLSWRALGRQAGVALLGLLVLAGCSTRLPLNPFNWYGTEFLCLFWGLGLVLLPLSLWLRKLVSGPPDDYLGPPLGTYELARLAGRGKRLADSALAALAHTGHLVLLPDSKVRRTNAEPPTDAYERAVWNLVIPAGWSDLLTVRTRAHSANTGVLQTLDNALEAKGLLLPDAKRQRLTQLPVIVTLALGAFGMAKVFVGASRGRPIGYLVLSLMALALAGWYCYEYRAWATNRGNRLLRETAAQLRERQPTPLSGAGVALAVALFGITELRALGLASMAELLAPPSNAIGGSDGGSGCSSSGCGGGGCGGCGGCGS